MKSASELLIVLQEKGERLDTGLDNDIIGEPMVHALPEIIAVVKDYEKLQMRNLDFLKKLAYKLSEYQ